MKLLVVVLTVCLFALVAEASISKFKNSKKLGVADLELELLQVDAGDFAVSNAVLDLQVDSSGQAITVMQGNLDNEAGAELDLVTSIFDIFFETTDPDNFLSSSTSNHISFAVGGNHEITLSGHLDPVNLDNTETFFSQYTQGQVTNLIGVGEGSDSAVELKITVQGLDVPLIDGVLEDALDTTAVLGDVLLGRTTENLGSRFSMTNPFSADIFINELHFDVIFNGDTIGRIDDVEDGDGILLPAKTTTLADSRNVVLDITGDNLNALLALDGDIANAAVTLTSVGSFTFTVGDLTATVEYTQDVRACQCGTANLAEECGDVVASGC